MISCSKRCLAKTWRFWGDFLKAVLDLPAEDYERLTVVDPNLDREFIEDKLGVLDVKVNTSSGKVIDIEVQVKP